MRIRIPADQQDALRRELARAGSREIGGQMYGEQRAPSDFSVTDLTFQRRYGTVTRFIVDLVQAARDALRFYDRTQHRYTEFNYIGEWHSHPCFEVRPSLPDVASMRALVTDADFRGHFVVLMIVRLDGSQVCAGGWLFDPHGREQPVTIEFDD